MTPRTVENSLNQVFSDLILLQRNESSDPFDLRENAPIMQPIHPKMIKGLLQFIDNPEQEAFYPVLSGKHYACYASISEVPDLRSIKGFPWGVFSQATSPITLFDFAPFGAAILSVPPLPDRGTPGIHQYMLPSLLEYALSPELWGPQGKWTRFHERLHTQFDKYKLLKGESLPGRYSLIPEAQKLEKKGIRGTLRENSFILTFPWTFPLSALEKLEAIISEEF